jgi:hypothetical protein
MHNLAKRRSLDLRSHLFPHPSTTSAHLCTHLFPLSLQMDAPYSGKMFRAAAKGVDPSRLVTANGPADLDSLDVQGFSHSKNGTFEKFHKENPNKPSVLSECCSCTSQRDSRSLPSCIASENSPGLLPYVSGSLGVWVSRLQCSS